MSLTLTQISAYMSENLGGDPEVLDSTRLANRAGRLLERSRKWNWLKRTPVNLSLVGSQAFVALPSDFGRMISLHGASGSFVRQVDSETFGYQKLHGLGNDYGGYLATVTTASRVRRLDLYPTPSANLADAFAISYYASWTALVAGSDIADIPADIEDLYIEFVRAAARGVDEDDVQGQQELVDAITRSRVFLDAEQWDADQQPSHGRIRGGIGSSLPHTDATVVW